MHIRLCLVYFVAGVVVNSSDSSETDSSDSSEAVIDFAIRSDVNNSTVNIYITPVENSAFNVTLSFKELHSCSNGVDSSLPGPEMLSGKIAQQSHVCFYRLAYKGSVANKKLHDFLKIHPISNCKV